MTNNSDITQLTVAELFSTGQYFIPIYQRNFAWGEPEVKQLLQDVLDEARRAKVSSSTANHYYIGTLVVDDKGGQRFETIDGQQRHTTLSLVLSALKNEFAEVISQQAREKEQNSKKPPSQQLNSLSLNLFFDNRKKSTSTLTLLSQGITDGCEQASMHGAYDVAVHFFEEHKSELYALMDYLLNQVVILRVAVPKGTDLNHYFEIMNNRGEQLEKHEVLKARLMRPLNPVESRVFSTIWDACASMDRYAQLGFKTDLRSKLFGSNWEQLPGPFESIMLSMEVAEATTECLSLAEIIETPAFREKQEQKDAEDNGRYSSIINFPNFLLQVLRITNVTELAADIPLDDKRLLLSFEQYCNTADDAEAAQFSREFVVKLLDCRLLFDRYIIKRKDEKDWSLEQLKPNESAYHYIASAGKFNQQMIMQLSMFHVSYPTQVYKHWLSAALYYLVKQHQMEEFSESQYIHFLDQLSDKFFYGRFGKGKQFDYFPLCFEETMPEHNFDHDNLKQGTHIQNFIFNRLDYRLWQMLKAGHVLDVDMGFIKLFFHKFSFTSRTSVEHFFPQHPIAGGSLAEATVHSFGNLCLISHSDNSKYSNNDPATKIKQAQDKLRREALTESLKQVFMMSYDNWGPDNTELIAKHEKMMIEVLCS